MHIAQVPTISVIASAGLPKNDLYSLLQCLIYIFIGRCCLLFSATLHTRPVLTQLTSANVCLYQVMNLSSGENWIRNERVLLAKRGKRPCQKTTRIAHSVSTIFLSKCMFSTSGILETEIQIYNLHWVPGIYSYNFIHIFQHLMLFTLSNVERRTSVIASTILYCSVSVL